MTTLISVSDIGGRFATHPVNARLRAQDFASSRENLVGILRSTRELQRRQTIGYILLLLESSEYLEYVCDHVDEIDFTEWLVWDYLLGEQDADLSQRYRDRMVCLLEQSEHPAARLTLGKQQARMGLLSEAVEELLVAAAGEHAWVRVFAGMEIWSLREEDGALDHLVARLGAADRHAVEAASVLAEIETHRAKAITFLEQATRSADAEVSRAAQKVLDTIALRRHDQERQHNANRPGHQVPP
ncbi:MAG: hypothetical protein IPM18_02310 [Phycisphaerales bacterium]|nr:hypothetical protein [Phycisphaerales bacterium]